jgi:hypothetical protein
MENDLQQKIKDRLAELPDTVQEAILSDDTGAKIRAIGMQYHLHIDQSAALEDATMLVMLGFILPEKFSDEIQRQLLTDKNTADAIIADIERSIFVPIRDAMKKTTEASVESAPVAPPQIVPAQSAPAPTQAPAAPMLPVAQELLTQKTAVVAPIQKPAAPTSGPAAPYKTDPYREPVE